jgi:hypothetical protein
LVNKGRKKKQLGLLFSFLTNILNASLPIRLPYKVKFSGLNVMAQVPGAQPTNGNRDSL